MAPPTRDRFLGLTFASTIFAGAFLLFQIQPLVSKQILPWFGGSPAVWTTCLLFFQSVLFVGYLYAHVSQALLRPKQQAVLHLAILAAAIAMLRVLPSRTSPPSAGQGPVWHILFMLAANIGLAYFVLSATGPLLQAWFVRLTSGRLPYRLYALSNLGSLLALVSYPFLFETRWNLPQQARFWTGGFAAFALLSSLAALRVLKFGTRQNAQTTTEELAVRPSRLQCVAWLAWPAFASIVLMATTNHVAADVAAMPFLWVMPLALYLLTFIIAFDHPRWHRPTLTAVLTLAAVYGSALVYKEGVGWINLYDCGMTGRCAQLFMESAQAVQKRTQQAEPPSGPQAYLGFLPFLTMNLAAMFGICLLCHGELARQRPHPRYLTRFYLTIAAGGALGGIAVSLLAPRVFSTYLEWKLAMFAAAIAALGLILHGLVNRAIGEDSSLEPPQSALASKIALVVLLVPTSFVLLDLVEYLYTPKKGIQFQSRNFFGTLTIRERNPENPTTDNLVLLHGAIVHGSQFVAPERRGQPTTYYSTQSGIGRLLNYYRSLPRPHGLRIGDIGLGAGTLSAYAGAGDSICFYEIDPAIIEIATTGRWFTYVADCQSRGADCQIKLGDGRLSLQNEQTSAQPRRYDVLVLDAFSGDSVPVHLLTLEAFELYVARLSTRSLDGHDGALAVNVSNRYLDLERVVRGAAQHLGLAALHVRSPQIPGQSINSADWMILSANARLLQELKRFAWQPSDPPTPPVLWTDSHSSLFQVLK